MSITDTYSISSDAKSLYCELEFITERYKKELQVCNVIADIETLKWAIEKSMGGSAAATHYVKNHGTRVLALIKERLFSFERPTQYAA